MFYYKNHVCVIMPLDQVKSLRYIMASSQRFTHGMPQNCIVVALRETIYGLASVHKANIVHRKLSVGQIFFHHCDHYIQLAYGPTSFDRAIEMEATTMMTPWQLPIRSVHD